MFLKVQTGFRLEIQGHLLFLHVYATNVFFDLSLMHSLPQLKCLIPDGLCKTPVHLGKDRLEKCTPHKGFDYFAGSEATFIIVWTTFGIIPFCK